MRRLIIKWGIALAERYPIPAGILLTLSGLGLIALSFAAAAPYAEFEDGARVVAQVVTAGENPGQEPLYSAKVTWRSEGWMLWEDPDHEALVEVLRRQLPDERASDPARRLRPGSELAIVVSTRNPHVAISDEALDQALILKLAGALVDGRLMLMGLLCSIGGGIGLVHSIRRARAARRVPARSGARLPVTTPSSRRPVRPAGSSAASGPGSAHRRGTD